MSLLYGEGEIAEMGARFWPDWVRRLNCPRDTH